MRFLCRLPPKSLCSFSHACVVVMVIEFYFVLLSVLFLKGFFLNLQNSVYLCLPLHGIDLLQEMSTSACHSWLTKVHLLVVKEFMIRHTLIVFIFSRNKRFFTNVCKFLPAYEILICTLRCSETS